MQEFHQSCDETIGWINEKDQALSSEDCGRDLAAVQVLQRRHQVSILAVTVRLRVRLRLRCVSPFQALERELAPVEEKIAKLGEMASKVAQATPKHTRQLQAKHSDIGSMWEKLKVVVNSSKVLSM